eukprot:gene14896-16442_t
MLLQENAQQICDKFTNIIEEVSEANLGKARKIKKPWITPEVIKSCDERREKKKKKDLGVENLEEYRKSNRETRKMLNEAKNKWIKEQTQEIDDNLARQNTKKAYEVVKSLSGKSSWGFYSNISGQEAEDLLIQHGTYGSFLCRRSGTTPGAYTLSVLRKKGVFHYKIQNDGECFNLYGEDGFASVPELLDNYRNQEGEFLDENGEEVYLADPLMMETSSPPLQQEKWFYGCIEKEETKQLLMNNGVHGSFLIRESQSRPGSYVLSLRNGNDIIEFLIAQRNGTFDLACGRGYNFPSLHHLLEYYKENPVVHKQTGATVQITEPLSISAERKRSDAALKTEFERLQQLDKANPATKNEGARPENKSKNRYKNILPFDHTRVKLRNAEPGIVGSDYINANYIEDDVTGKFYIASQGCMKSIVVDFWQMIYQENSRIIIMLTNEVEKGKIKCVRYWPDVGSILFHGDKTIANVNETSTRDYIVRELHLSRRIEVKSDQSEPGPAKPPRKIFFYQYTEWPDHGVPNDPGSLLQMLQDADNKEKRSFEKPGPPVIHCR